MDYILSGVMPSNFPEISKTKVVLYLLIIMGELAYAQEKRNYYRLSKKDARAER